MTNDPTPPATAEPRPPLGGSFWDDAEVQGRLEWWGLPWACYFIGMAGGTRMEAVLPYFISGLLWPFLAAWTQDRVSRRRPPGRRSRALSAIAWAHAPWLLFIPFWGPMTSRTGLLVSFPPLWFWSIGCLWLALDSWRPRWTPTFWRWLGMGAWLIFALLAVLAAGAAALAVQILGTA